MGIQWDTASTIINDAAVQLGLTSASDVFGSTDPNFIQLIQLFKLTGRKIRDAHQWTKQQQIFVLKTTAQTSIYSLPNDLRSRIDQAAWNRTNRLPLGGPMSPQDYEFLKARLVGVVFTVLERQLDGQFVVYPDGTSAPGNYIIAFEYNSNYWVVPAGTAGPADGAVTWFPSNVYAANAFVQAGGNLYQTSAGGTSGTFSPAGTSGTISDGVVNWTFVSVAGTTSAVANGDTVILDSRAMSTELRKMFLEAKGMPSQAAADEARAALAAAFDADSPSPILDFSKSTFDQPIIGERNLPITGYGM